MLWHRSSLTLDGRVRGVLLERVLLRIGGSEDVETGQRHSQAEGCVGGAQRQRLVSQVAGLR